MDEMRLHSKPKSATVFRFRLFRNLWNNWLPVILNQHSFNQLNIFTNGSSHSLRLCFPGSILQEETLPIVNPGCLI